MIFGREPALIIALWSAAVILAIEFGLDLTEGQQAAIMGIVIAAAAVWIRAKVTPVS